MLQGDLRSGGKRALHDLNGDFTADKTVDQVDGKVRISTSTKKDGQFDLVEWPRGGFGW